MYFAGIDIGSRAAKVVIMKEEGIASYYIADTGLDSIKISAAVIDEALKRANLTLNDIDYVVATGYGRAVVPFANENRSDVLCHSKGAHWHFPKARTILDIGGQDSKAINCDERGKAVAFMLNNSCAGGTGRFLEVIANIMEIPLEEIGAQSLNSKKQLSFSTACVIFAKSEALNFLREGAEKDDVLAGLHNAVVTQCLSLLRRISIEKDFVITGGVAQNIGIIERIKKEVGLEVLVPPNPQLVGAVGAAALARERFLGKQRG